MIIDKDRIRIMNSTYSEITYYPNGNVKSVTYSQQSNRSTLQNVNPHCNYANSMGIPPSATRSQIKNVQRQYENPPRQQLTQFNGYNWY